MAYTIEKPDPETARFDSLKGLVDCMTGQYIVVSSITYAYKGRDALERKGCKAFIEKAPHNISECGCHYLLRLRDCPIEKAMSILNTEKVRILATGSD